MLLLSLTDIIPDQGTATKMPTLPGEVSKVWIESSIKAANDARLCFVVVLHLHSFVAWKKKEGCRDHIWEFHRAYWCDAGE